MNIIIFGGSFDPIHVGHVKIAERAAKEFNATVYFVPSPIGVWKSDSVSKSDKLNMLKLAIEGHDEFKIDEFELNSGKDTNYSIDTVKHFKEVFPNDTLYFLMGSDQANKFNLWQGAKELSELAHIIFYPRVGIKVSEANIKEYNMTQIKGNFFEFASSSIRNLNNLGLDDKVLFYILDHELYFVKKVKEMYGSEKLYNHAVSVGKLCIDIARANKLDLCSIKDSFFVAGYLHDIGKHIAPERSKEIMVNYFPDYLDMPPFAIHQFVGAKIAEEEFGINDELILEAIKYHTTGHGEMTALEKVVYAADKIDPLRGYDSTELINAMMEDIDSGFKTVLKANVDYLNDKGKQISDILSDQCIKQYLK